MKRYELFKKHFPYIHKSIVFTPILFLLAFFTGGAGHGTYFFMKLIYPYTMLSILLFGSIKTTILFAGTFQYVFYGLILTHAESVNKLRVAAYTILIIHTISFVLCLVLLRDW
jgi:hypothetical protein